MKKHDFMEGIVDIGGFYRVYLSKLDGVLIKGSAVLIYCNYEGADKIKIKEDMWKYARGLIKESPELKYVLNNDLGKVMVI